MIRILRRSLAAPHAALAFLMTVSPVAASVSSSADTSPPRSVVVQVADGALRGVRHDRVDSFLGIRYAQPPTGDLRWAAPRPVAAWKGVLPATDYGNRCPANASTNGPLSLTEDCLFLNVQRPAEASRGARLPVYLWIHGGGLVNGSSNQHDGTKIVDEAGVIVVTINYRLGPLGFLAHPALTAAQGESGDYGFMDQQAALRWVQRNIAAFGGDPSRVTVGGESAGGWSVCAHLSAPASRGLFARAIIESGSCLSWSQSDADAAAGQVASAVGCPTSADAAAIACLRAAPVQALLDAGNNWVGPLLVSQNRSLPQDPDAAVTSGAFARVPVLVGSNRDEGRTFTQDAVDGTKAQYEQDLQNNFGPYAAAIEARYPWPSVADRWTMAYLIGAIITDGGFIGNIGGCANRTLTNRFASYTTTYSYQFDHRTGPGLTPLPGYVWGAGHAAELAYMWPSFNNGTPIAATFDAAERRLAHDMVAYWGAFIRSGSPDAADGTPWPRLRPSLADKGRLLSLRAGGHSTSITDGTLSVQHQCDFWATVFS